MSDFIRRSRRKRTAAATGNGPFPSKPSLGLRGGGKRSNCSHTFCEHRIDTALRYIKRASIRIPIGWRGAVLGGHFLHALWRPYPAVARLLKTPTFSSSAKTSWRWHVRYWHLASFAATHHLSANGPKRQSQFLARSGLSANDPKRTSPWTWVQLDPRSRIWNVRPPCES